MKRRALDAVFTDTLLTHQCRTLDALSTDTSLIQKWLIIGFGLASLEQVPFQGTNGACALSPDLFQDADKLKLLPYS